jgi:hypothetical protein
MMKTQLFCVETSKAFDQYPTVCKTHPTPILSLLLVDEHLLT